MHWATLGRGRLFLHLFMLPAVLYILAWRITPALYTVYLSFTSYHLAYDPTPTWIGLGNYVRLLGDGSFYASLRVTLLFTVIVTTTELVAGMGAALLFNRDLPARNLLLGLFLIPMVLAPVVVGTIWYILFNKIVGPIPYLLQSLRLPQVPWLATPSTALFGLVLADVWQWTPFVALLLLAALQAIPREIVEAATVDGASGASLFRHITLPQITGMIAVAVALRFMDAFREIDKVIIMTGGGPGTSTEFVSMHVYKAAFRFFTLGYAAAMVVVLLFFLSFAYALYLRAVRNVSARQG